MKKIIFLLLTFSLISVSCQSTGNINKNTAPHSITNVSLILAVYTGNTTMAHKLIAEGANVNAVDKNGATALIGAILTGHIELVKRLLLSGVDLTLQGENAVLFAFHNKHTEILDILIEAGANAQIIFKGAPLDLQAYLERVKQAENRKNKNNLGLQ